MTALDWVSIAVALVLAVCLLVTLLRSDRAR